TRSQIAPRRVMGSGRTTDTARVASHARWTMPMRNVIDPGAGAVLTAEVVPAGRLLFSGSAIVYAISALVYLIAPPTEPHLPIAAIFVLVGSFFALVAWL